MTQILTGLGKIGRGVAQGTVDFTRGVAKTSSHWPQIRAKRDELAYKKEKEESAERARRDAVDLASSKSFLDMLLSKAEKTPGSVADEDLQRAIIDYRAHGGYLPQDAVDLNYRAKEVTNKWQFLDDTDKGLIYLTDPSGNILLDENGKMIIQESGIHSTDPNKGDKWTRYTDGWFRNVLNPNTGEWTIDTIADIQGEPGPPETEPFWVENINDLSSETQSLIQAVYAPILNRVQDGKLSAPAALREFRLKVQHLIPPISTVHPERANKGIENLDTGEIDTERSETVYSEDFGWMSIPTIFNGKLHTIEESTNIIESANYTDPDTGRVIKAYNTEEEANSAARIRESHFGESRDESINRLLEDLTEEFYEHEYKIPWLASQKSDNAMASGLVRNFEAALQILKQPKTYKYLDSERGKRAIQEVVEYLRSENPDVVPAEALQFFSTLSLSKDQLVRLRTGATVNEEEVRLFDKSVGSPAIHIDALQTRIRSTIDVLERERAARWNNALYIKYGGNPPEDVLLLIPPMTSHDALRHFMEINPRLSPEGTSLEPPLEELYLKAKATLIKRAYDIKILADMADEQHLQAKIDNLQQQKIQFDTGISNIQIDSHIPVNDPSYLEN